MKVDRRAAFLDRDDTLLVDSGYMDAESKIEFMPGVIEGLRNLRKNNIDLILVSNQSGVSRGLISVEDVYKIENDMLEILKVHGIALKKSYYCFHSPSEECDCRKPNSGLLLKAISDFEYLPKVCAMFGDKETDVLAAEGAGVPGYLVKNGEFLNVVNLWLNTEFEDMSISND
jgi:D-glycero-D-manno-heptose 1,7-bisphosphate phosphatase